MKKTVVKYFFNFMDAQEGYVRRNWQQKAKGYELLPHLIKREADIGS